jgi:tRNA 2-thiouridine synthesizing protein A
MMTSVVNEVVDLSGLLCPEPVMMLHAKVREVPAGYVLKVIATDPSTWRDIPKFCQFLGHELLDSTADGEVFTYVFRTMAKTAE